jgi:hypothetical protein
MAIKNFTRFIKESSEVNADYLKSKITTVLGFSKFKVKSSLNFQVLVDGVNRIDLLRKIENLFSSLGAKYDPNKGSSSVGAVVIGKFSIGVAPLSKQGKKSAGLDNEDILLKQLNDMLRDGPMHITFKSGSKSFDIKDVKMAEEVGLDTSNRKKSDINLITVDGRRVPLSLKKDNAEMWESADSYWSTTAKKIIDEQVAKNKAKLQIVGGIRKIVPNIAVKATPAETKDVVFGNDILPGKGAVLYRTFSSQDFKIHEDGDTIVVSVSEIYRSVAEVEKGKQSVYFLIRNDSSRRGSKIYPGIRVLAVGKSRINPKVLVVNR